MVLMLIQSVDVRNVEKSVSGVIIRIIHNRCGFHIVEFWNKYQHGPAVPEEEEGNWSMDDEMFVFRKVITDKGAIRK